MNRPDPIAPPTDDASAERQLLYAPHHRAGRFFCPWAPFSVRTLDVARWKLLSRNAWRRERRLRRGAMGAPAVANDGAALSRDAAELEISWVGHSTFALHHRRDVVLTDPHWGPRALVPRRLVAPGLPLAAIPDHAFVLQSHNHYDHLDDDTARRLPRGVDWYVPLGLGAWVGRRARGRVVELDWWQTVERGRFRITCLPAQHWSNRLDQPRLASLWCGWLLESDDYRIYFAGDTGSFSGFAEFGRLHAPIDVALLPIGAYEPRWFMRPQHMNPAEAWRAFQDLGARHFVGMHWGCFDLTDEPANEGAIELDRMLGPKRPENVHLPQVGETLRLGRS